MIWTHIYDLLLKVITLSLSIIIVTNISVLESHDMLKITISLLSYFLLYNFFVRTISSYLYCRIKLKTKISLKQAEKLNNAFSPILNLNFEWLPMLEIRNMKESERYEYALEFYKDYKKQNKSKITEIINTFSMTGHKLILLKILMYSLIIYFFIAGIMNLPPASFLSDLYCRTFETEEYYPMLNICILILPTLLIFKKINPNVN